MKKKLNLIIIFVLISFQALHSADELKLTHPNGGEVLKAGEVTKITWEELSAEELVKLNFSSDNGETWNTIADSISGSTYYWVAPLVESDSCLVVINQYINQKDQTYQNYEWSNKFIYDKKTLNSIQEASHDIIQTSDDGYISIGSTNNGNSCALILKIDEFGNEVWFNIFDKEKISQFGSVINTSDDGFIVVGFSTAYDSVIKGNLNNYNGWVLKYDKKSNIEWSKFYGTEKDDSAGRIVQSEDNGFVIAGAANYGDNTNTWIFKLNSDGELIWEKIYGGNEHEFLTSLTQTFDGGYIVSSNIYSSTKGYLNFWIYKLDSLGEMIWDRTYGGSERDLIFSLIQSYDGGYFICGLTDSKDGDFKNNTLTNTSFLTKLNINGDIEWTKFYPQIKLFGYGCLSKTNDGGVILAGSMPNDSTNDGVVLKIKEDGDVDWTKTFGGNNTDQLITIKQTRDGGFVTCGFSNSTDGDFDNIDIDKLTRSLFWVLKIPPPQPPLQSDTSDAVFSIKVTAFDYFVSTNEQYSTVTATVILEENTNINLKIYDILGRRVVDLFSGEAMMGKNEYKVDFAEFQSGRYYIKLTTPTITKTEIFEVVR